jgi:hypothetical protein
MMATIEKQLNKSNFHHPDYLEVMSKIQEALERGLQHDQITHE